MAAVNALADAWVVEGPVQLEDGRRVGQLQTQGLFYSMAITPQDREAFPVNLGGKLLQFCALPM